MRPDEKSDFFDEIASDGAKWFVEQMQEGDIGPGESLLPLATMIDLILEEIGSVDQGVWNPTESLIHWILSIKRARVRERTMGN
jgi:hypothetical protein